MSLASADLAGVVRRTPGAGRAPSLPRGAGPAAGRRHGFGFCRDDARTSALCALVAATDLDRKVFADLDRKQVKARLKEIAEGSWAATAVKKTIDEIQSAVMVAVIASSAGASGAAGSG
jgi:hypothetical protein